MKLNLKRKLAVLGVVLAAGGTALGITLSGGPAHLSVAAVSRPTILLGHGASSPVVGDTLTTTTGTWSHGTTSFDFQWQNCNSSGASCSSTGADQSSYTIVGNVGGTIRVAVTAHNLYGAATQTSTQTALITSGGGGGSRGLGVPNSVCTAGGTTGAALTPCRALIMPSTGQTLPLCSTDTTDSCEANILTGMAIGNQPYPHCTVNCSIQGVPIGIPPNLDVHDPAHPVPVFIVFPDGYHRPFGIFNNSVADNGQDGWDDVAAHDKIMIVDMFPDGPATTPSMGPSAGVHFGAWGTNIGQFQYPVMYGTSIQCTGTVNPSPGTCDDALMFRSIVNYLTSHYSIDPNWIVAGGGSKGGAMSSDILCDPSTESVISGIFMSSDTWSSTGTSPSNGTITLGGRCPSLLAQPEVATSGPFAPQTSPAPKPIMILHQFSWMDAGICDASSVDWSNLPPYVGTVPSGNTPPSWSCYAGGLNPDGWHFLVPDILRRVYVPAFGCATSPINTTTQRSGNATDWPNPASVLRGTVRQIQQTYQCPGNRRVALWAMGLPVKGSGCHAYSCTVPNTAQFSSDGVGHEQAGIFLYFEFGSPTTDGSTTSSTS